MPLVRDEAIVLQAFPYGETSRILRLLTEGHGLQSAIAKGARRPRSQYGGVLEPFSQGTASLYIRETRDLQTLSGFELGRSRQRLGRDLLRFGGASLLAEIVLRTTMEGPQHGLFPVVADALDHIECQPEQTVEAAILAETWRLIACLGFAPELRECLDCGRSIEPAETTRFDYTAGGIRCTDCGRTSPGRAIPGRALVALRAMASGTPFELGPADGHWWLLARYLDHHVLEGASLHSLDFIANARGA